MAATAIKTSLAVVTGTTRGIGVEIARALLKNPGVHVIGTGRSEAAGVEAAKDLGSPAFTFVKCDITSDDDVKHLAAAVDARSKEIGATGLRILVNNAGLAFKGDTWGADEARQTLAVNFFGTARVTEALLPHLRAAAAADPAAGARVVNVCSQAGRLSQVSPALQARFQDASATKESIAELVDSFVAAVADGSYAAKGWPRSMYGISKLAEIALTYVHSRMLLPEGIAVNAVCPGYCATEMSSFKGPRTPAQGAETPAWLALREGKPSDVTGGFWYDGHLIAW